MSETQVPRFKGDQHVNRRKLNIKVLEIYYKRHRHIVDEVLNELNCNLTKEIIYLRFLYIL